MHEKIMYGREQLDILTSLLEEMSSFLTGDVIAQPCEESKQDNCLLDSINTNNDIINQCLETANHISNVIVGKRG